MAAYVILILLQLFVHGIWGIYYNPLSIQPMNPRVREGDNVIVSCHTSREGSAAEWWEMEETYEMFQSIELRPFAGGVRIHLIGAKLIQGEETSSVPIVCFAPGNIVDDYETVWLTIVPRSFPIPVQSNLLVFHPNPVTKNGSDISLICIDQSESGNDIGWYVPADAKQKFASHVIETFENGAHLRIAGINVYSPEATIAAICVQTGNNLIEIKQVTILVTDRIWYTRTTFHPKDLDELFTAIGPTEGTSQQDSGGASVTLVHELFTAIGPTAEGTSQQDSGDASVTLVHELFTTMGPIAEGTSQQDNGDASITLVHELFTAMGPIAEGTSQQDSGGASVTLVLIAIGIGAALAVFCLCSISLAVYTLFCFRSQSSEHLIKDSTIQGTPAGNDAVATKNGA